MSFEPMLIGPNPCRECGGEYGEHAKECSEYFHDSDAVRFPEKTRITWTELGELRKSAVDGVKYRWSVDDFYKLQEENERLKKVIAQHDLCHDLDGTVRVEDFAAGCAAKIRELYGLCPWQEELAKLRECRELLDTAVQAWEACFGNVHANGWRAARLTVDWYVRAKGAIDG